jgi:UDP-2-acetamido-3-amino-2,3-dideoxy-glucuronate N-acetyltransferase
LGNHVKIQNNVSVYDGVILEDDVFCGPSMVFTNVFNPRSFISRKKEFRKTVVGRGATIGANATIVCGNRIGQYAFIGASSVVTDDVPDYALVYGNPGKVKGWVCQCAEGITFRSGKAVCKACRRRYQKDRVGVKPV